LELEMSQEVENVGMLDPIQVDDEMEVLDDMYFEDEEGDICKVLSVRGFEVVEIAGRESRRKRRRG
jgi:hypothetical protein